MNSITKAGTLSHLSLSIFVFPNDTCTWQGGVISKLMDSSPVDINAKPRCHSTLFHVQATGAGLKLWPKVTHNLLKLCTDDHTAWARSNEHEPICAVLSLRSQ